MSKVVKRSDADKKVLAISQGIEATKNAIITPNDLRLVLMDYVDINIPLYKEHLNDEQLWKCIEWGVSSFNEFPPLLSEKYTIETFPYRRLLLDLATVEALKLTAKVELRGEMQYSDGGISSTIYYKAQQYMALAQELQARTDQEMSSIKRSININSCYGELC